MIDYYFIYGPSFDDIVASYRTLTGTAPLFPKWAYGLFQSYNAYGSQSEITNVVNTYRADNIPLDVIVQNWHYWGSAPWGSHVMDPTNYPNPAQMLSTFHSQNIHGMISVWGYFQPGSSTIRSSSTTTFSTQMRESRRPVVPICSERRVGWNVHSELSCRCAGDDDRCFEHLECSGHEPERIDQHRSSAVKLPLLLPPDRSCDPFQN